MVWPFSKSEPTTRSPSSRASKESMQVRRHLQNKIPADRPRDGNTSTTAAVVFEYEVTTVDLDSSSEVLVFFPSSGTNDATGLKHDNAMDMDVPKVQADVPTVPLYHTYSDREPNGNSGNSCAPEVNHDGCQTQIQFLRWELERFSNQNATLWQTNNGCAHHIAELQHILQTERCNWKNDADRQQTQIEGFHHEIANLKQTIDKYAHDTTTLEHNLKSEKDKRKRVVEDFNMLQHNNSELERRYADLQQKLDKKNQSYKEMAKNYMDQIRPIRVTDDDTSTIYNRLTHIRVSIEQLIQRARGDRSANLNKDFVLEYIRNSKIFAGMANLEPELSAYHLDLCMESAVMSTLVYFFFQKPLGCIFENDENFEDIHGWVYERDTKIADRWRQQLCKMAHQDPNIAACKKRKVRDAANDLSEMVSRVYSNVDMSDKITELCDKAFELAIAMFGFEYVISPIFTPLGTPFDDETMTMPQKSNPAGTVTLEIFPAFSGNNNTFSMKAKVWCY